MERQNMYLRVVPELKAKLQELAKKNKGKTPLEALVIDKKNNLSLTMKSRDLMVNPRKMMNALGTMKEVDDIKPVLAQY